MPRPAQHRSGFPFFDDLAGVEHRHAVAQLAHDGEIMADEEERNTFLSLQISEERDDLRLDRDVERGCRLVEDQERRLARQRRHDQRALAHAARELVRIGSGDAARLVYAHVRE